MGSVCLLGSLGSVSFPGAGGGLDKNPVPLGTGFLSTPPAANNPFASKGGGENERRKVALVMVRARLRLRHPTQVAVLVIANTRK